LKERLHSAAKRFTMKIRRGCLVARQARELGREILVDTNSEALLSAISTDNPCGDDLELVGDLDFMNALARAESLLPNSFFKPAPSGEGEEPFGGLGAKDFQSEIDACHGLLERSRDVRTLVNLAKFAIFSRDVASFVDYIEAISSLLRSRWDDVNPKGEGGDFSLRVVALGSLADRVHILLPLQFTPLLRHPREGAISYRTKMLSDGATPRPGEETIEPARIIRALNDVDLLLLVQQRDRFERLVAAVQGIRAANIEHTAEADLLDLDPLLSLAQSIRNFLDDFVGRRDPTAAKKSAPDGAVSAEISGSPQVSELAIQGVAVTRFADVSRALAQVATYLRQEEPSNPALLLIRQAERLVGKTFLEVLEILLPDQVGTANIGIGRVDTFDVPLARLATEERPFGFDLEPEQADGVPLVTDRRSALARLQAVEAFYAVREPTSPIPFLCERARKLGTTDFVSILREILPENVLKSPPP